MKQYLIVGLSSLLSALLAVFAFSTWGPQPEVIYRESQPARYTHLSEDPLDGTRERSFLSSAPTNFTAAAETVTPAVVNIRLRPKGSFDRWSEYDDTGASSGSGVIISPDGFIVTNNHVIEGDGKIEVTLFDKKEFVAELAGVDPSTDMALLRIKAKNLPFLQFGNSDSLRVGEWVLAVGNPFNLASTVTAGIVSAKARSIDILEEQDRIESFIQTDAAVNPGNSGGALVNSNGELVGINTAIITRSGRYEGYSFAVPSNLVRKVVKDLRDFGVVQRAILGVFIEEVNGRLAAELKLPSIAGVHIKRVTPGSSAEEGGLRSGDVIVGINGISTKTLPEMQEQLGRFRPGNAITIEYLRKTKRNTAKIMLKNKSNSVAVVTAEQEGVLQQLGFDIRNLTKDEVKRLRTEGVKVVSIYQGGRIERTNMDPGFIITKLDNIKINNVEELIVELKASKGKVMLEGVYENYPGEYYYAFPLE